MPVTFVRVQDPYAPESPNVPRHVSEEVVADYQGATAPESEHDDDAQTPLAPPETRHIAPITWSAGRTPLADLDTPDSSLVSNSSSSINGDVLVVQLMRHFREGPGQWYVPTSIRSTCFTIQRALY
jgi:hypothetical protein